MQATNGSRGNRHAWGRRLARWRRDQGISQAELGRRIGVRASSVCQWETGNRRPTLQTRVAVERVTDGKVPARLGASKDELSVLEAATEACRSKCEK